MMHITLGIFSSTTDAEYAIYDLREAGYSMNDISLIARNFRSNVDDEGINSGNQTMSGVITSAATGSIIGGLGNLLTTIYITTFPELGSLLISGPVTTMFGLTSINDVGISRIRTSDYSSSFISFLIHGGVSEEDATIYERGIAEGGILLATLSRQQQSEVVKAFYEDNDADQVKNISLPSENRLHREYFS